MQLTRRTLLTSLPLAGAALAAGAAATTKMKIYLSCGAIGVKANPWQALDYAAKFGFEAVEADAGWLSAASESDLARYLETMRARNLVWAQAGLSVEFRKDEAQFQAGLKDLPLRAKALQRAGVQRVGTWILPMHPTLTYLENLKQHATRLRAVADILDGSGCRLGMEYVGPKTLVASSRFTFVHTLREMRELMAEINRSNLGVVLDSWHWFTSGETVEDLKTLTNREVVSVDLNDAPSGVPLDQLVDGRREIPCATGVIPVGPFLSALNALGCDAPVRCEPFNAALRAMQPEQALQTTIDSLHKAFALIQS